MENTPSPSRGTDGTGGSPAAGQQYGWKRSRPVVSRKEQSPVYRAFQCVLQIARSSVIGRGSVGVTISNRRIRTRTYGGVAGDGGRPLPLCRSFGSIDVPGRNGCRIRTYG